MYFIGGKAFILPTRKIMDRIYSIILEIFNSRCAICGKPYDCFHEIVPKSLRKNWHTIDNTVSLCALCHEEVHRLGTRNSREELQNILYEKIHKSKLYERVPREMFFDMVQDGEANRQCIAREYSK